MHFYKHHIGDYAQATAHLSFVEDAAYGRLIRKYYADEKPLPADVKAAQRLVGARTREERAAVESVLREFFTLEADGWRNKRCDAEIEKAQAKAARNREVGKLGGRPAGSGNRDGSEQEPRDNPEGFPVGSENNPSQDSKTPRLQDFRTIPGLFSHDSGGPGRR